MATLKGAQYRKKPVVVEAVQIAQSMAVETLEGRMQGNPGDWLITGVRGEQYFCKDDIFRETYEPVNGGWLPGQPGEESEQQEPGQDVMRLVVSTQDVGDVDPDGISTLTRVRLDCGHGFVVASWSAPKVGKAARCGECTARARKQRCACEGCDPEW
jgi:hypothetical protein